MLFQIVWFLLDVAVSLIGGACLLRLYMQRQRVPFGNPVGQLVFALSDWIVLPLRKLLPTKGNWDVPSLVAAFALLLVQMVIGLLLGAAASVLAVPWLALCGLLKLALMGMMGILLAYAVLSWVQPYSPIYNVLQRLADPLLAPIRKIVPLIGNVDLSALVGMIVLQVALIVLAHVQAWGLGAIAMGATGV
ncbi:YggT family protein [Comamonas phosphati]|nr:YggT family protein [Comamonas phosphati]